MKKCMCCNNPAPYVSRNSNLRLCEDCYTNMYDDFNASFEDEYGMNFDEYYEMDYNDSPWDDEPTTPLETQKEAL